MEIRLSIRTPHAFKTYYEKYFFNLNFQTLKVKQSFE